MCGLCLPSQRMVPNGDNPSTNRKANPLLQRYSYPEIVSPVPLRHHALQPELTPDAWIRTPSPSSSRAISPATPLRGGNPRRSRQNYRFASFSTVMDAQAGNLKGPEVPVHEQGLGRRWLRWMHKNGVKHWVVPCTLLASVLVRWCIGLGPYSGTLTKTTCQRCLTSNPHCRGRHSSYVWGLRSPAALDGAHQPLAVAAVVYIRSAILGFRLPPVDRLSFLALR